MEKYVLIPTDYLERLEKKLDNVMAYIETNYDSRSAWLNSAEAMKLIGCKKSKLSELRLSGAIEWRSIGGRNIMMSRKSIEAFIKAQPTHLLKD